MSWAPWNNDNPLAGLMNAGVSSTFSQRGLWRSSIRHISFSSLLYQSSAKLLVASIYLGDRAQVYHNCMPEYSGSQKCRTGWSASVLRTCTSKHLTARILPLSYKHCTKYALYFLLWSNSGRWRKGQKNPWPLVFILVAFPLQYCVTTQLSLWPSVPVLVIQDLQDSALGLEPSVLPFYPVSYMS